MAGILDALAERASSVLGDDSLEGIVSDVLAGGRPATALWKSLTRWARADARPLVLLIDEIDSLPGDSLLSVLRQLRSGYDLRPNGFPQSIVLCGVSDVLDYRIPSGSTGEMTAGGSGFNISADSLRLADFDRAEVDALLGQHTCETGQGFEPAAVDRVYAQTAGQPWLVNALCYEACFKNHQGRDRSRQITEDAILAAQEALIKGRVVYLNQFAGKLQDERVRRVIEPMLSGAPHGSYTALDLEYVRDLGLVALDTPPRLTNPTYAEVVPRELTFITQKILRHEAAWYIDDDDALDVAKLLAAFRKFFREDSDLWLEPFQYKQAGPQLLLQAFVQRVLSGGGRIEREYGLGRQRVDLLLLWPRPQGMQRIVIECKILRDGLEATLAKGLPQTAGYMDRCGAAAGHLLIFDRSEKPWEEKVFRRSEEFDGMPIEVWGM